MKASVNSASPDLSGMSVGIDPKRGELTMARVNPVDNMGRGPNPRAVRHAGMSCG